MRLGAHNLHAGEVFFQRERGQVQLVFHPNPVMYLEQQARLIAVVFWLQLLVQSLDCRGD